MLELKFGPETGEDIVLRYGFLGDTATVPIVLATSGFHTNQMPAPDLGPLMRFRIARQGALAIFEYADGDTGSWVRVLEADSVAVSPMRFNDFAANNLLAYGATSATPSTDVYWEYIRIAKLKTPVTLQNYMLADFQGGLEAPFTLLNEDPSLLSYTARPGWLKQTSGLNTDGAGRPRRAPNALRLAFPEGPAVPVDFEADIKL